jgi:predicted HTH transcriptional regulator
MGAKRDVLAEVVAMANIYGGDVVLGIEESEEKPPRAIAVHHMPECIDLASRHVSQFCS